MIPCPRLKLLPGTQEKLKYAMETLTRNKVYSHYNHTDPCKHFRWTARECYQFMYARSWQQVLDFYSNVVNGRLQLSALFETKTHQVPEILEAFDDTELRNIQIGDRTGRWARVTFKIVLSYHGGSFDGWQKQPGLNTVQGLVERSLGKFIDEKKVQQLKDKCLPVEGCAIVAGRTDKGVTALQQVCAFYTWRKDVKVQDVEDAINSAAPGKLRVSSVSEVPRVFHPNFSAKWRRYFYIFPFNDGEDGQRNDESEENVENVSSSGINDEHRDDSADYIFENNIESTIINGDDEPQSGRKPRRFSISRVNLLLHHLEGKLLSYKMFARDTKASRNAGPPTECFVYHARAAEARLPSPDHGEGTKVMCVELVANRFLRKMVRVLVATAIREAAAGAGDDALLKLMDATCRRATAPPAPPDGLCLADVGYTEFDPHICLIF
ncbi:uncharacterized protein LOC131166419 isoform X1 [Malania oleifera]|nr:uncharacterized protein LOC131166419 isoform X1 [Malania oleifera]